MSILAGEALILKACRRLCEQRGYLKKREKAIVAGMGTILCVFLRDMEGGKRALMLDLLTRETMVD